MEKIPIVQLPIAKVGTIQGTSDWEVQPNQKRPMGRKADSTQAKYSLPSGVVVSFGQCFLVSFSW